MIADKLVTYLLKGKIWILVNNDPPVLLQITLKLTADFYKYLVKLDETWNCHLELKVISKVK